MERDSFVFYRSFFEAITCLDAEEQVKCFNAIAKYALDGEESDIEGATKGIFLSIKPQIDANNKRYVDGHKGAEHGKKGGRPKKENPTGVIDKNPIGVIDENPKETPNVNENENVNVNENENVNYQQIADMYNDTCVSFPRVTTISDSRKKAIRARLKKYSKEDLQKAFVLAEQSDFLKGGNNRDWTANFDWMMKDSNLAKLLDGNYNNKSPTKIEIDSSFRQALRNSEVVDFGM